MNPLLFVVLWAIPVVIVILGLYWEEIEAWRFNRYVHEVLIPYVEERKQNRE